jgi:hypothetical protein
LTSYSDVHQMISVTSCLFDIDATVSPVIAVFESDLASAKPLVRRRHKR